MACECETYGYCSECRRANIHWIRPDVADENAEDIRRQEAIAEIVDRVVGRLWPEAGEVRP